MLEEDRLGALSRTRGPTLSSATGEWACAGAGARCFHCQRLVGESQATRRRPRPSSARAASQRADIDSGELELFEAFLDITRTAVEAGFDVAFRWVPREQLTDADALFSLTEEAMHIARVRLEEAGLGSWDVDRFAAAHNAKAPRFDSLFATEGAEAVDAFSQSWSEGISFVLHNFNQLGRVLDHVERDDAEAVIVIPEWTRRPFWRRIESGAWRQRVALDFYLEPGSITANRANTEHCFFGDGPFNSRLRVMRTK